MGQICAGQAQDPADNELLNTNKVINAVQNRDALTESRKVKLLLLGAGESGKSTIFKQIKERFQDKHTESDLISKQKFIWANIIEWMQIIMKLTDEQHRQFSPEMAQLREFVLRLAFNTTPLTPELGDQLYRLFNYPPTQESWHERAKSQAGDSLEYFMQAKNIERIAQPDYIPNFSDHLYSRVRTTGMTELEFTMGGIEFKMMDVGGQRSERRKWIAFFDNVTALIFVVAINEFDQTAFELTVKNRMMESEQLWERTLHFKVFRQTPVILFLNKVDLLRRKVEEYKAQHRSLDQYFPTLQLGEKFDVETATSKIIRYLEQKFASKANRGQVHAHAVSAIDTDNITRIFNSTVEVVVTEAIKSHFGPQSLT